MYRRSLSNYKQQEDNMLEDIQKILEMVIKDNNWGLYFKANPLENLPSQDGQHIYKVNDVSNEDKKAFIDYWTEPNKSGTKMRFELERTWHLSRRLSRWVNSSFNKTDKSKFPDFYDAYIYKKLDTEKQKEYESHLKSLGWISKYTPTAGIVWNKKR